MVQLISLDRWMQTAQMLMAYCSWPLTYNGLSFDDILKHSRLLMLSRSWNCSLLFAYS